MPKLCFSILLLPLLSTFALAQKPVRVFLVRHAETGPKPERLLSARGERRAQALAALLASQEVTHLYSTKYARTMGTLAPIAKRSSLKIEAYRAEAKLVAALRNLPGGSVAVVAGHSNTIPNLVKRLGGKPRSLTSRGWLPDAENDRLYIVTLAANPSMIELRYGNAPAPVTASTKGAKSQPQSKPTSRPSGSTKGVQYSVSAGTRRNSTIYVYRYQGGGMEMFTCVNLGYSAPAWREQFGTVLMASKSGARLRLGKDFFTTCDTNCPLQFGDVSVAPGCYYLALEKVAKDRLALVFLDAATARRHKWVGASSSKTTGGIRVPLDWKKSETSAKELKIEAKRLDQKSLRAALTISFGPHELRTEFVPAIGK